jgi:hypothetical protein
MLSLASLAWTTRKVPVSCLVVAGGTWMSQGICEEASFVMSDICYLMLIGRLHMRVQLLVPTPVQELGVLDRLFTFVF